MPPDVADRLRPAGADDAPAVAALHARSWRATYRGAFSDAYLDGPIGAERLAFWRERLRHVRMDMLTLLLEDAAGTPLGFVCGFPHHDARWGTLVDNLHVDPALKGRGRGRALMRGLGDALRGLGMDGPVHLFVLAGNDGAAAFYARLGGHSVERMMKTEPDGSDLPVDRIAWASLAAFRDGVA